MLINMRFELYSMEIDERVHVREENTHTDRGEVHFDAKDKRHA